MHQRLIAYVDRKVPSELVALFESLGVASASEAR